MCRHTRNVCQCGQASSPTIVHGHDACDGQNGVLSPLIPKVEGSPPPPPLHSGNDSAVVVHVSCVALPSELSKKAHDWATLQKEARAIFAIALPMVLTGLLLYCRSMVSMLFFGRLGELPLAGGALAIGFANITGYSILSGLAIGMEPICGQAFGAHRRALLGHTLQRTVLLLLCASAPIALFWLNMRRLLLLCGQDPTISAVAQEYILFSLPDLVLQSFLHPLRIYLRAQSITMPLSYCAAGSLLLHVPVNYLLVPVLGLGVRGVALAGVFTNFSFLLSLSSYVYFSGLHRQTGGLEPLKAEALFQGWWPLLSLAAPSCVSVCLEWWWYEVMTLLCGLLSNPSATVAAMGILIQTTSLTYTFPSSLGCAVSTRVGNELGADRPHQARTSAFVGLACSFALSLAALGFALSVRHAWPAMFTSDADVGALVSAALPIVGLCELGNCPQTAGCGVLRGSARPRAGADINVVSFYGVGMPVAVGLAFYGGFGFRGLWLGMLAAQAACVALVLAAIVRTDWAAEAERARQLTGGAPVASDAFLC